MQNVCFCYLVCKYLILITKQAMVYDCVKSMRIKQVHAVLWKRNNNSTMHLLMGNDVYVTNTILP